VANKRNWLKARHNNYTRHDLFLPDHLSQLLLPVPSLIPLLFNLYNIYNISMSITMTDNFVKRLKELRESEKSPELMLRIRVDGGGCQGFEYAFIPDTVKNDDDHLFEKDGAAIIVDDISLPFLTDSEVDYVDDLIGAHFKINNPNATSSCGCGTSFSV
jgi:iron-sulfur cluster insertion protein